MAPLASGRAYPARSRYITSNPVAHQARAFAIATCRFGPVRRIRHGCVLPLDRDEGLIAGAAGILATGGANKVVASFADAHRGIGGGIAVEDRQSLEALGKDGKIDTKNDLSITKAAMRAELEQLVTVHLEGWPEVH